ncbi:MAG TPA: hypothetical protein VFH44_05350 [Solirubrobacterales bacterium]|nr:hypothetical protein [Solirubrobacterales bacterium]
MKPTAIAAFALAALAALAVGFVDSGDPARAGGEVQGVGQPIAGSVAALAQCSDWNEGTEGERAATIDDIYAQVNQAGADGPTPDLPDEEAYALFERSCRPAYAAGFRLYKLYLRAAAFEPLVE